MLESSPADPWWFRIPVWVWMVAMVAALLGIALVALLIATSKYRKDINEE